MFAPLGIQGPSEDVGSKRGHVIRPHKVLGCSIRQLSKLGHTPLISPHSPCHGVIPQGTTY